MKPSSSTIWSSSVSGFLAMLIMAAATGLPATLHAQEQAATETSSPVDNGKERTPYPVGFDDLSVDLDEFELQLRPLTKVELSSLAERWQEIARGKTKLVIDATIATKRKVNGPSDADFERIQLLTEERNMAFKRFSAVVTSLQKKNGDETEVADYRAYRNAVVADETQNLSWQDLGKQAIKWVRSPDGGGKFVTNLAIFVGSLIALIAAAKALSSYSARLFGQMNDMPKLMRTFFARIVYWLTIGIGFLILLSSLGIDITPVFAIVGGGSFILAFAMQETLGNLAAGLMLMFNNPFDEGDYITAGNTSGTVKSVSIVSTTIVSPDNQIIVVPNSMVWGDVITNSTASETRRVDLVFGIDYEDDPDKAAEIILEVARADKRVLGDPPPWVRVTNLGESSVDLTARLWCRSEDYWELKFEVTKAVKLAFDKKGISIPYPHSVEIRKAG